MLRQDSSPYILLLLLLLLLLIPLLPLLLPLLPLRRRLRRRLLLLLLLLLLPLLLLSTNPTTTTTTTIGTASVSMLARDPGLMLNMLHTSLQMNSRDTDPLNALFHLPVLLEIFSGP